MPDTDSIAAAMRGAYAGGGEAWEGGPARMYDKLAAELVATADVPLAGLVALDCGAGTGAASKALVAAGAKVIAIDNEADMLNHDRANRPPALVADINAMPFVDETFGAVVAAFSLNHVATPEAAMREIRRVSRRGAPVLASVFAIQQPPHAAKDAVETVAKNFGFEPPPWYVHLKRDIEPLLGTADRLRAVATAAGLGDVSVTECTFDVGIDSARDLVHWRLGMAHLSAFMRTLSIERRDELIAAAVAALPDPQPLRPAVLMLSSRA